MSKPQLQFNMRISGIPAVKPLLGTQAGEIVNTMAKEHQQVINERLDAGAPLNDSTLTTQHTVDGIRGQVELVLVSYGKTLTSSSKAGVKLQLQTTVYLAQHHRHLQAALDEMS